MAPGRIHTTYRRADATWTNHLEDNEHASSVHDTKAEAVARGRDLARNARTEHVIHNIDGTISERNSYGHDPFPPRG